MAKKVGLALGAGSTKGFAHIGVLQVFEENGVPVDLIAGSSMGAIIGAIYAVGSDMYLLEKYACSLNLWGYFDLSNPLQGGLLHGERLRKLIRIFTHDKRFEETRIPFCCVSVDAKAGELCELDTGKLCESVRASMSIPGIFMPVELDGKTLVDGGVIERVPCRTLRVRGADVVIGVDVGYRGGVGQYSGTNAYAQINRALEIMQWENTKLRTREADILIAPEVLFVKGRFETSDAEAIVGEGRRAAENALPAIYELLEQNGIPRAVPRKKLLPWQDGYMERAALRLNA